MHFLYAMLIGLFIGLIARFLMPGPNPHGIIVTSLLGIAGALVATFVGQAMNMYGPDENAGFIASVLGAMLVLFVYHMAFRRRA